MTPVKRILSPLSSLKLTVVLLMLSMLLVFAGTLAQRDLGVFTVQQGYFHSLFFWLPLRNIFFGAFTIAGKPLVIPMLGGYSLGVLLLVNLLSAHILRFKARPRDLILIPALALIFIVGRIFQSAPVYGLVFLMLIAGIPFFTLLAIFHRKRTGVILIHLGLILLVVGEGLTSGLAVESQMTLSQGEAKNWSQDIRFAELAITDHSPADHDQVTVVPVARLQRAVKENQPIHDSKLPFDLQVDAYYPNSQILGPMQMLSTPAVLHADAGSSKDLGAIDAPLTTGAGATDGAVDAPAAYVTLSTNGQRIGRFLLLTGIESPQEVNVGNHTYEIDLRFRRLYKPYTVSLIKFSHDRYAGTSVARNYSSLVHLVDPSHHEDRQARIWMNHPLRYQGETFFQSSFRGEDTTILQIVTNPGWQMPYIACAVGTIGLVTHFLMTLIGFLRKQLKETGFLKPGAIPPPPPGRPPTRKPSRSVAPLPVGRLATDRRAGGTHLSTLLPIALIVCCGLYVLSKLFPHIPSPTALDLQTFGTLPVTHDGRTQPLDSLARNSLKIISGKETFTDDKGDQISAVQWLLDTRSKPLEAAKLKVFRIDLKDITGLLTTDVTAKMFSLDDLLAHWPELGQQFAKLPEPMPKSPTLYQAKLDELRNQLRIYFEITGQENLHFFADRRLFPVPEEPMRQLLQLPDGETDASLADVLPQEQTLFPAYARAKKIVEQQGEEALPPGASAVYHLMEKTQSFLGIAIGGAPVLSVPPPASNPKADWSTFFAAAHREEDSGQANPSVESQRLILASYKDQNVAEFNSAVTGYHARLAELIPGVVARADHEAGFNKIDPFYICLIFYVIVFVLVALSWLRISEEWTRGLLRAAFGLILLAILVHTIGLGSRVYISGRPPVTNLASSAIFIAWGVVILATAFELFYRNGIGLTAASIAGFLSLLIADRLAAEGDTLEVLQAVLDTNGWLATHVVCVTLGYASTFLAGVIGVVYVVWSLTGLMNKDHSRIMGRMIYGVVCFAMLFSFVGTVLGGIWADQSWGRFWGWDPKENGAVLIVLSNALLLHARWGGMIKARGIANLAILGNIITAWSWFGTNMLGIGLHAYGFMGKAYIYLILFVISQLSLATIGLFTSEPTDAPVFSDSLQFT